MVRYWSLEVRESASAQCPGGYVYITDHSPLKLDGYSSEKLLLILLR